MPNISKIHEALSTGNGPAQACHYICNINPPLNVSSGAGAIVGNVSKWLMNDAKRHVSLLAESVSLPGRQLLTTEQKIFGTLRKLPYGVQYEDVTISFICTNSMMERSFFDSWHNFIMAPTSQYMEYYQSYVGEIIIQKVTNDEDALDYLSTYKLLEAYPISIQSQELSYENTDVLKLTVQFAYSRWSCTVELADQGVALFSGGGRLGPPRFA